MVPSTKVSVFGGTGFIGSNIIEELVNTNYKPKALVRESSISKLPIGNIEIIKGKIDDQKSIDSILQNSDVIIYAVGIIRENTKKGISFDKVHFEYFRNIVDLSKENGIKRIIYVSANGVKELGTKYQTSKYKAEQYLKYNFDNWTVFRPSVVYGEPKGKMEFMTQLKEEIVDKPFPVPLFFKANPLKTDQFFRSNPTYVKDLAQLIVKSINSVYSKNKIHEVGGPVQVSWKYILKSISQVLSKKKFFIPVPITPIHLISKIFDKYHFFPITSSQIKMLREDNICDSKDLFEQYDIKPLPFSNNSILYLDIK